jgi:hypothetical protein
MMYVKVIEVKLSQFKLHVMVSSVSMIKNIHFYYNLQYTAANTKTYREKHHNHYHHSKK